MDTIPPACIRITAATPTTINLLNGSTIAVYAAVVDSWPDYPRTQPAGKTLVWFAPKEDETPTPGAKYTCRWVRTDENGPSIWAPQREGMNDSDPQELLTYCRECTRRLQAMLDTALAEIAEAPWYASVISQQYIYRITAEVDQLKTVGDEIVRDYHGRGEWVPDDVRDTTWKLFVNMKKLADILNTVG